MKHTNFAFALVSCIALIFMAGCATSSKPPPEDFYVALSESSARWGVYLIARNNLEEAAIAKTYLAGVDVEKILTYQQWKDLIAQAPIKATYKLAISDAIALAAAYVPEPDQALTPVAKRIIKAVIRGGISGIEIALSEEV